MTITMAHAYNMNAWRISEVLCNFHVQHSKPHPLVQNNWGHKTTHACIDTKNFSKGQELHDHENNAASPEQMIRRKHVLIGEGLLIWVVRAWLCGESDTSEGKEVIVIRHNNQVKPKSGGKKVHQMNGGRVRECN